MSDNDYELFYLLRDGNYLAKEVLFQKYIKYIYYLANTRLYLLEDPSLMLDDIYQEGIIAFFNAVDSYKDDKDVPFIYYMRLIILRRFSRLYHLSKEKKHVKPNFDLFLHHDDSKLKLMVLRDMLKDKTDQFIFDCLIYDAKPRHIASFLNEDINVCYRRLKYKKQKYRELFKILKE